MVGKRHKQGERATICAENTVVPGEIGYLRASKRFVVSQTMLGR